MNNVTVPACVGAFCTNNGECSGYYPACNTSRYQCVQCMNDTDCVNNPTFGWGYRCEDSGLPEFGGVCQNYTTPSPTAGCTSNSDCMGDYWNPICNTTSGDCVACMNNTNCVDNNSTYGPGYICQSSMYGYTECVEAPCYSNADCGIVDESRATCNTSSNKCVECFNNDTYCQNRWGMGQICSSNGYCEQAPCYTRGADFCSNVTYMSQPFCNYTTGRCSACNNDADCTNNTYSYGPDYVCKIDSWANYCELKNTSTTHTPSTSTYNCTNDGQCAYYCDDTTNQCVDCRNDTDCMYSYGAGYICGGGSCYFDQTCTVIYQNECQPFGLICRIENNMPYGQCSGCNSDYECETNFTSGYTCQYGGPGGNMYCTNYTASSSTYTPSTSVTNCTYDWDCYPYHNYCDNSSSTCVNCRNTADCENMNGPGYYCSGGDCYWDSPTCNSTDDCSMYGLICRKYGMPYGYCESCWSDNECSTNYTSDYTCQYGGPNGNIYCSK